MYCVRVQWLGLRHGSDMFLYIEPTSGPLSVKAVLLEVWVCVVYCVGTVLRSWELLVRSLGLPATRSNRGVGPSHMYRYLGSICRH